MCNHIWIKIFNFNVCNKCGATILQNGSVIFDRKLPDYLRKKGGNKNGKK